MDLDGRVVIVTGAGRGIGRADALHLAELGAQVVVNDLGAGKDGTGRPDTGPADEVVDEIRSNGGTAVANYDDVADWEGAESLIRTAVDSFGRLHGLVNNVGILRNKMLFNATPDDWDLVVRVNLRGTFAPTRWAAAYWRAQRKAGVDLQPTIVNTVSHAGIFGSPGGTNYAAGKGGAIMFSITAARELAEYGVRVNAVGPAARSRLTDQPGSPNTVPVDGFDELDPANVAPLIAYLSTAECPFSGGLFGIFGGRILLYGGWEIAAMEEKQARWTIDELAETLPAMAKGRDPKLVSLNATDPGFVKQQQVHKLRRETQQKQTQANND